MFFGMSTPIIAKRTDTNGTESYSDGFICGKAIGTDVTPNYNEASAYGDNVLAEYAKEFKDADVNLNVTTLPSEAVTVMFGHTINQTTGEIIYGAGDSANEVGYGFFANEQVNGEKKYLACWLPRVKFTEAAESYTTKGDSIEFKNPSLSGKGYADNAGNWKHKMTFDTEAEAVAWLKEKAGIVTAPANTPSGS